jgi:hypothetical protein
MNGKLYISMKNSFIWIAMPFLVACKPTCVQDILAEIPVTATYQDTMQIGDTIHYAVRVPNYIDDLNTGKRFSVADYDLQLELLVGSLGVTTPSDSTGQAAFELISIEGNIEFGNLSNIQVGTIQLSPQDSARICSVSIVARKPGKYQFVTTSIYARSVRVIDKQIQLFMDNDCIEALNLLFPVNDYSTVGYEIFEACGDSQFGLSREEYAQEGVMAFVVE